MPVGFRSVTLKQPLRPMSSARRDGTAVRLYVIATGEFVTGRWLASESTWYTYNGFIPEECFGGWLPVGFV